jgi:hypothetical protein
MNIESKMAQLKTDPNYAGLFKVDVISGSGSPTKPGGAQLDQTKDMTPSQKMAAGRAQQN